MTKAVAALVLANALAREQETRHVEVGPAPEEPGEAPSLGWRRWTKLRPWAVPGLGPRLRRHAG